MCTLGINPSHVSFGLFQPVTKCVCTVKWKTIVPESDSPQWVHFHWENVLTSYCTSVCARNVALHYTGKKFASRMGSLLGLVTIVALLSANKTFNKVENCTSKRQLGQAVICNVVWYDHDICAACNGTDCGTGREEIPVVIPPVVAVQNAVFTVVQLCVRTATTTTEWLSSRGLVASKNLTMKWFKLCCLT